MTRVRGEEQPGFLEVLESWLVHQQWFPARRGRRSLTRVGGLRLPTPAGDTDPRLFLEMHIFDVDHVADHRDRHRDRIAVPVAVRSRPSALAGKNAFIGRLSAAHEGEVWLYDGARDRTFLAAWLEMARRQQGSRNGRSHGEAHGGFAEWDPFTVQLRRTASESRLRPVTRTQITPEGVAEDADPAHRLVVEFQRRPRAVRDVEVETVLALGSAHSTSISQVLGIVSCSWEDRIAAQTQGAEDVWVTGDLAIIRDAAGQAPDGRTLAKRAMTEGTSFTELARRMGVALGTFHADLAGAFGAHPQTRGQLQEMADEARAALGEQWEHVRGELDAQERADISDVIDLVRSKLCEIDEPMTLQRIHGELSLTHAHLADPDEQRWIFDERGGMVDQALPLRDVVTVLISLAELIMEATSETSDEVQSAEATPVDLGQWHEEVVAALVDGYRQSDADVAAIDSVFFRAAMLTEVLGQFSRRQGEWIFRPSMLRQPES